MYIEAYMGPMSLQALVPMILVLHFAWILWVILGAFWTRYRPVLTAFHLGSLVWGVAVEVSPLPCPLTDAEQWLEAKAGVDPYHGSFLVHYLDQLVYPNVPESLLVYCGVAVCGFNLLIYLRRYWIHHNAHN
jgi:hypothetical protein